MRRNLRDRIWPVTIAVVLALSISHGGFAPTMTAAADAPPADELDDALLDQWGDELDDDLLEGLDESGDDESDPANLLDAELLQGLEDGEDIGDETDPLLTVGRDMRTAEQQIADMNSGDTTQRLQSRIVEQLNELIKQVRQQCQASQAASQGDQTSSRRQVEQPGAASSAQSPAASNTAADSTDRLDATAAAAAQLNRLQELLKNVWGHLPEKEREQMLQNATEKFLPKYSLQIEQYFQRLVELETERR